MKSSLGSENDDIAAAPRDGQVLLIVKPGQKLREKKVIKNQDSENSGLRSKDSRTDLENKMPSIAERDSLLSAHLTGEDSGGTPNSSSSAPHSPLKPVAQVSPFRSMPQSPYKGPSTLSVKDIVDGLADTAANLADNVHTNGGDGEDTKDLTESDILTRMIRENLNKAVTGGTPDEMKKSLNDAIRNTFKNRTSNSNSSVSVNP